MGYGPASTFCSSRGQEMKGNGRRDAWADGTDFTSTPIRDGAKKKRALLSCGERQTRAAWLCRRQSAGAQWHTLAIKAEDAVRGHLRRETALRSRRQCSAECWSGRDLDQGGQCHTFR